MLTAPATPSASTDPKPLLSLRMLATACVVVLIAVYATVGAMRYRQLRAETEVRLDRALRIAVEHALKVFDTNDALLEQALDTLGDDAPARLAQRAPVLEEEFRRVTRNRPQVQAIEVRSADGGRLLAAVGSAADPAPAAFDRTRLAPTGMHFSVRAAAPGAARPIDMSRARVHADGRFAGTVSVTVRPATFEQFHRDLVADEPGLAITMLRDDGLILTRWPLLPGAPSALAASSPVMARIRAGQTRGDAHGVSSVDGRERLLRFSRVGDYPVYLGSGMEVREITRRWLQEMAWLAAFGVPPLIGLFLAARVALRRTREALGSARRLQDEMVARRQVEEALLQAQKLEALGRLTGGVAHDFNNTLMVISSNLFVLRHRHPDAGTQQVESMDRAVASATQLTRQLLAFSRRQALVPEHVRLQDRLPALASLLAPVLGAPIELAVSVDADCRPIRVDPAELELGLINLAINARDAMPASGRFRLSACNVGHAVPAMREGPAVLIEAVDSGTGIDGAVIDKVFEPFFTTKPVGEGTGLGLSQVYGLCRRAGGTATIESEPGRGTTVRLYFPAADEPAEDAVAPAPAARRALGKKVLVVEDNDAVAAALQPLLESIGCSVVRLDRGRAAEEWLARQSRLPDLVLTDVVMPGEVDGLKLARHVRATYPGVGIVVMTGHAEQLDTIAGHGFAIIPKPCSVEVLAAAIERGTDGAAPTGAGQAASVA
ncbi:response regulator [Piscinibacter koreensis]|uniref:histidine kinase n=1 Tax=Piscinibacter koreensis TaxID=2742824 RepID=A0A7Y6NR61_9BURK|nr:response regulator [Schlegelella koreensis]NUZ07816.1 response regulator [Schlegelella koreensis]